MQVNREQSFSVPTVYLTPPRVHNLPVILAGVGREEEGGVAESDEIREEGVGDTEEDVEEERVDIDLLSQPPRSYRPSSMRITLESMEYLLAEMDRADGIDSAMNAMLAFDPYTRSWRSSTTHSAADQAVVDCANMMRVRDHKKKYREALALLRKKVVVEDDS